MQEIDELLSRADRSLEKASPDRSETYSIPNSFSLRQLGQRGNNHQRSKSTFRPGMLNVPSHMGDMSDVHSFIRETRQANREREQQRDKQLRAYLQSKQVSPKRYRAPPISIKKTKLVKA